MGGLPGAAVLKGFSASKIELAGVLRSTRWHPLQHLQRSGVRYSAYLGCAMLGRLSTDVPQHATRDCNDAASRAFIDRLAPDLVVTAFFNQRLLTPRAAVNIHPSLLPALRGVDPVFYARLRGVPLGVSVHRLTSELDTGPVLAQREVPVVAHESILGGTVRLYGLGARLLVDLLPALGAGQPQRGAASYDSWPARVDVQALRRKGVSLVRWRDLRSPAR